MKDKRIVVCDDQKDICSLIKIFFEKKGCEVFTMDHLNTVDQLLSSQPDMILMDLKLPGIGGVEAVRQIQRNETLSEVPVILISGNAEIEEISRDLQVPFISKPFQLQQLVDLVKTYFEDC